LIAPASDRQKSSLLGRGATWYCDVRSTDYV
jgi:hypothetical protein